MKEVMKDFNTFDWEVLDGLLAGAASRCKHVALSFFIHWPNSLELQLPDFLVDCGVAMFPTDATTGDSSPDYQNPDLLIAMEQFIRALGRRYDGDRRLLTVHISLVGFWCATIVAMLLPTTHVRLSLSFSVSLRLSSLVGANSTLIPTTIWPNRRNNALSIGSANPLPRPDCKRAIHVTIRKED
jgi:hypothetical protein